MSQSFYVRYGKRLFDLFVGGLVLLAGLPFLLLAMLLLAVANGGKVFFLQERPGLKGEPFVVYKLKTMSDATDEEGNLLPDEDRRTVIGDLIRKSSIDEIMQLVNVLKGDMSLIGPRPLLMEYLEHYSSEEMKRHDVLPGITGLAQVKGRNALSWERRFRYDVFYVRHISFSFDLLIVLWTIKKIVNDFLIDDEIYAAIPSEEAKFTGTKKRGRGLRNNEHT